MACATGAPGGPEARPAGETGAYERSIHPFPAVDADGIPYDHPFLGGWNAPRPQWVDIDEDGDPDLFVQETSDELIFFEAIAEGGEPRYVWRTDRFHDLEVGEWYRFVDLDRDGRIDLLAERPFSYIRLYRNVGSPGEPRFELATDSLRSVDGEPIFSDRQNIPNAADIDCDGRLDLLIGRLTGTITRYEESADAASGVPPERSEADGARGGEAGAAEAWRPPRFRHLTDRFENIEIIGQFVSARHGANTLALADIDGDGDLDLLWGDFFEPGLLWIRNTGSCRAPSLAGTPVPFPPEDPLVTSGYNAPTAADIDGDGHLDLLVGVLGGAFNPNRTTVENLHLLEGTGDGRFVHRTGRFVRQVDVGSESIPSLADVDGDGDLDLFVGNKIEPEDPGAGRLHRFANDGSPTDPAFRYAGALELGRTYHLAPAFADLDGDGLLDLVVGSWRNRVAWWRNEGTPGEPRWVLADSALVTLTRGSHTVPALGDLDGDGTLDLIVGEASGTLNRYRNEGTAEEPRFTLVSDEFLGIDVGRRSAPVLVDLDGDGDLDLVVGSEAGGLHLFRNAGAPTRPEFVAEGTLPVETRGLAAPAFGDLDGDGDLDLVVGALGGGLLYLERR